MLTGNNGQFGQPGAGYSVVNKFGENPDIDTIDVPVEIWSHGADGTNFVFLSAGVSADFKSSSINDDIAGTGAQKIRVTYFLSDYTEVIEEFETDGTTQVEISDDFLFCSRVEVTQTGTGNTNAGEINIVDRATGLIVYQSVEIGEGQTLSALQMCPKGKKGNVSFHYCTFSRAAAALNAAQMKVRLRRIDGSTATKYNTTINNNHARDERRYDAGGISVAAGEIVYWECIDVSANDTPVEAGFDIEFENI